MSDYPPDWAGFAATENMLAARGERQSRLAEISSLEAGWLDGEGQRVGQRVITLALTVGDRLTEHGVIGPSLYPTIEGGVVFEWSRGPQDLSIEAKPDLTLVLGRVHVGARNIAESTAEEPDLSEAIAALIAAAATPQLYVSAPASLDLRPLLDGLKQRGAQPYLVSDVASPGADALESLRLAIQGADQVLVVLGDPPTSDPVFDAGLAIGLGKPLLIIAAPGVIVPAGLARQVIAQARPGDLDAINFTLDHLRRRAPLDTSRAPSPGGRPLGAGIADQLLYRLSAPGCTDASRIEGLAEAIEASGSIATVKDGPGRGFDLGVWSDDLEAVGGNPLLVKVTRSLAPGTIDQARADLADHPSARLGLVVYQEAPAGDRPPSPAGPGQGGRPVLAISLQQILRLMASASFAEVVRDIGNRNAHGLHVA